METDKPAVTRRYFLIGYGSGAIGWIYGSLATNTAANSRAADYKRQAELYEQHINGQEGEIKRLEQKVTGLKDMLPSQDLFMSAGFSKLDRPVEYSDEVKKRIAQYQKSHPDIGLLEIVEHGQVIGIGVYPARRSEYGAGYAGMDEDILNLFQ